MVWYQAPVWITRSVRDLQSRCRHSEKHIHSPAPNAILIHKTPTPQKLNSDSRFFDPLKLRPQLTRGACFLPSWIGSKFVFLCYDCTNQQIRCYRSWPKSMKTRKDPFHLQTQLLVFYQSNFRPLPSSLLRSNLLGKAIFNRLSLYPIIPSDPFRFSYRPKRWTLDVVYLNWHFDSKSLNSWVKSINYVFLNYSTALDSVPCPLLLHRLESFGCPVSVPAWLKG